MDPLSETQTQMQEPLELQEQKQLRVCLEVYLQRGVRALEAIDRGDWDKVEHLLTWRNAAFHNFRAAESILSRKGISYQTDPHLQDVWQKIKTTNLILEPKLRGLVAKLRDEHAQSKSLSTKLTKFHSGLSGSNEQKVIETSV